MGSLEEGDREAAAVQKTPNRVTLDSMRARIANIEYFQPRLAPHMMIVIVKLDNGYVLVGKSAPADPANFDAQLGMKLAEEDALRQMWPLEGYLLREKLSKGGA